MNKYWQIAWWTFLVVGVAITWSFVQKAQQSLMVDAPIISIDNENENRFVDEADIMQQINFFADTLSYPMHELHILDLEKKLNRNFSIEEAQVYKTITGDLKVDVRQRKPIARVYTQNESYYMDEHGRLMPLSNSYTARVTIVNGVLNEPFAARYLNTYSQLHDSLKHKTMLDDVYRLVAYINSSDFWRAQIEQVYVNKDLEFELIPKVGNHKIVFGAADGLENKFEKLMLFYTKALTKTGWNEYSTINLKYKDQVVGTKVFD